MPANSMFSGISSRRRLRCKPETNRLLSEFIESSSFVCPSNISGFSPLNGPRRRKAPALPNLARDHSETGLKPFRT
jgi:hypothetical protein